VRWSIILLFFLFSLGCNPNYYDVKQTLWPEKTDSYYQLSQRWTRQETIHKGLDQSIDFTCTLQSLEWSKGFAQKWAKVYGLNQKEANKFCLEQIKTAKTQTSFFLAISGPNSKLTSIDVLSPLWRIFLQTPKGKVYPLSVRELEWPFAKVKTFYPLVNPWQRFYLVEFPPINHFQSLIITGPEGRVVFQW